MQVFCSKCGELITTVVDVNNIMNDIIEEEEKDMVNHPVHYNKGMKFEVIDVIEDWDLGFHLGNAVKYIARADHKGKALEDLKKAQWYLNREIERRERK